MQVIWALAVKNKSTWEEHWSAGEAAQPRRLTLHMRVHGGAVPCIGGAHDSARPGPHKDGPVVLELPQPCHAAVLPRGIWQAEHIYW